MLPALLLAADLARAATPKGDVLLSQAKTMEEKGTVAALDEALTLAVGALKADPSDSEYVLVEARIRAFCSQGHVHAGDQFLGLHKFSEALAEYEKAASIDPAPSIARDNAKHVRAILDRLQKDPSVDVSSLLLSPRQNAERQAQELFATIKPPARLEVQLTKPLPQMRVNSQPSGEIFALIGKYAGVRVLFDPDYQSQSLGKNTLLDFRGLTLEEALDYVSIIGKSFWRPLSRDTILVANEDPAKRGLFDDQVTKVLYLSNAPTPQEVQRIGETVKNVTEMKRLLIHPDQSALVLRGDLNRVALAQKLVEDLDKPKAEIIIDVIVLSVSKDWVRDLGLVFGITSSNLNVAFAPRASIGGVAGTGGGPPTIPLSSLQHLSAGDFGITLPGAALNALLSNQTTKIVDKAQLRTIEGQRSTLRIGQKVPYATGSFTPGGAGNTSPLVNTQFQFFDVGLNIDVLAKVHEPDEVSLHIESDHSAVADYQNVGGLVQPVLTQRKRIADVRVKEGEVNFWDIVTEKQTNRTVSGIPGLMDLPWVGRFFESEHREDTETLLLHLLIPHIIRSPDIREVNVLGIASGSDQVVKLSYTRPEGPGGAMRSAPTDEVIEVVATQPNTPPPAPPAATGASAGPPAAPNAPVAVGFSPATVEATVGSPFSVEIVAGPVTDLTGATLTVKFDAAFLTCVEAGAGALLTHDGAPPRMRPEIDNAAGTAVVRLIRAGEGGATGQGPLISLKFEAKQPGATTVALSGAGLRSGQQQDIPANPGSLEVTVK